MFCFVFLISRLTRRKHRDLSILTRAFMAFFHSFLQFGLLANSWIYIFISVEGIKVKVELGRIRIAGLLYWIGELKGHTVVAVCQSKVIQAWNIYFTSEPVQNRRCPVSKRTWKQKITDLEIQVINQVGGIWFESGWNPARVHYKEHKRTHWQCHSRSDRRLLFFF